MNRSHLDPEGLHVLIGKQFSWQGERWTALEIIEHPLTLIAEAIVPDPHIQTDTHGRAHRTIQSKIASIPILDPTSECLHPTFLLIQNWSTPDPQQTPDNMADNTADNIPTQATDTRGVSKQDPENH